MTSINTVTKQYHVGEDDILHLDIPTGLSNVELEVTVTFQPVSQKGKGWMPRLVSLKKLIVFVKNDPIVIDSEGIIEGY
jgi:hypothetical protein